MWSKFSLNLGVKVFPYIASYEQTLLRLIVISTATGICLSLSFLVQLANFAFKAIHLAVCYSNLAKISQFIS